MLWSKVAMYRVPLDARDSSCVMDGAPSSVDWTARELVCVNTSNEVLMFHTRKHPGGKYIDNPTLPRYRSSYTFISCWYNVGLFLRFDVQFGERLPVWDPDNGFDTFISRNGAKGHIFHQIPENQNFVSARPVCE